MNKWSNKFSLKTKIEFCKTINDLIKLRDGRIYILYDKNISIYNKKTFVLEIIEENVHKKQINSLNQLEGVN